jgi:AmpE protein
MKLLVILLCLLSERYLVHAISYQRFYWIENYYRYIKKIGESHSFFTNPWVLLALVVVPIILVTALIYCLLSGVFFGLMGLLLSVALFFYSLGPQNVFYPVTQSETESPIQLVGNYFSMVNRQLFAVVFWYIVAGPIAALSYRLFVLCREMPEISVQATEVSDLLEWIPARLTALLLLLVGNFQKGLKLFLNFILAKPDSNNEMLRQCGLQAARANESDDVPMPVAESLVEHAMVVMLVFIALFTLISWF